MTREQATELVEDLLQAAHDYELFGQRKSYKEHYYAMKQKAVEALTTTAHPSQDRGAPHD